MNIYNIYIILSKKNTEIYSIFIKSFISYFLKLKSKIIEILDYGYYFYNKKINKLYFFKICCNKKIIIKMLKIFNHKKNFIINIIVLKNNINKYLLNLKLISYYISDKFKIYPSIIKKIKYKTHNKFSKIIKILRIMQILPNNFISYIKKINLLYDK
ncbi:hypothetical protein ACJEC8_00945 [Candidatus Carsonella ruddii]|uniref:hypothetical protein n=1 Tax=Carsonella ruddii TaxID=114186 RepID=UPI003D4CDBA1